MEDFWNQIQTWCKNAYEYVVNHVPIEVMIYIGIGVLILILVGIMSRAIKKRRVQKRLSELEVEVNEIRQNTLQYKFNKAEAFAKANEDLNERVKEIKPKYEICVQSVQACENLYEKAVDYFNRHKYKKAIRSMDEVETVLEDTTERIKIVNASLDNVLSKESEIRQKAEATKMNVRKLTKQFQDHKAAYSTGAPFMEEKLGAIEKLTASLDENLAASSFNKAKEDIDRINDKATEFAKYCNTYPALYLKVKKELPDQIMAVKQATSSMEAERIDPSYLNVDDKLDAIQNALDEAVARLDNGNLTAAAKDIDAITDQVLAVQEDVTQEHAAFKEIHNNLETNFAVVDQIEEELTEITRLYASIKDRFGLEDWTKRFVKAREQMDEIKKQRDDIQRQLSENESFQVEVIGGYREFSQQITDFGNQVMEMKQMLIGASSDESRARKQLVKLQLILNEVKISTSVKQLPAISESFEEDMQEGERKILEVQSVLDASPLNVNELNKTLQDAIDFIYKLYSNASNLVGVAVMVENAIVFANRFRSSYPALDLDLNKAEVCFQNGEYTRALKLAIQAIESVHPGIYEKLVARKDPAVMNQV